MLQNVSNRQMNNETKIGHKIGCLLKVSFVEAVSNSVAYLPYKHGM